MSPVLYIVIPCYNEEEVLPITCEMFLKKLDQLTEKHLISAQSRILFVNDGSTDRTWEIICDLAKKDSRYLGVSQSRNRGHQNAVLAGLMTAREYCDIAISIDCDGQDDINAMDEMVKAYLRGYDVVYGVRNKREKDTFFKKLTAESFYRLMQVMGAEIVFNHADYRLMSKRAIDALAEFKEVNLFLRGMVPLVGFPSTQVSYERDERIAGESHYPLSKMLALAFDGITSLSVQPIRMITTCGILSGTLGLLGIIAVLFRYLIGGLISGWASTIVVILFLGGIQLISLGVLGEYIGKIYMETKRRPRYILSEKTWEESGRNGERGNEGAE